MERVTEKQIREWKEKYPEGVFELPVDDKTIYFRAPKMSDWKRAFTALKSGGDVAYSKELMTALYLGGDMEIINDDDYFLSVRNELNELLIYEDAIVEKQPDGNFKITVGDAVCICRKVERLDLQKAEKRNPGGKPFVTQQNLFNLICLEKSEQFNNRNDAEYQFPLMQALEDVQKQKFAILKKL